MATLTQLEYMIAIDQCRHFGRAAEMCHVSQPTLSAQLRKLEDEIGVVLFDRNKQPILPTEEGQAFIEQARVVLNEFKRFCTLSQRSGEELSGEFTLALIPTVAPYLLPLFLPDFTQRYPKIRLTVEELPTARIIEALDKDQVDAGILATPLGISRIEETPLYYEPFFVFVGKGHRLERFEKITESMLRSEELWLLSEEHCLRDQILTVCKGGSRGGCFPSVHVKGGSIETVSEMVSQGHGCTLLPQMATDSMHRRLQGHILPMARPAPAREISLVHRRGHLKHRTLSLLASTISKHLPRSLPREKSKAIRVIELTGRFR